MNQTITVSTRNICFTSQDGKVKLDILEVGEVSVSDVLDMLEACNNVLWHIYNGDDQLLWARYKGEGNGTL